MHHPVGGTRRYHLALAATLVACALVAFPRNAQAGTITVTDNVTYPLMNQATCTLSQAIVAANSINGQTPESMGTWTRDFPGFGPDGTDGLKRGNCPGATPGPNTIVFAPALAGATLTYSTADFIPGGTYAPVSSNDANHADNYWYSSNALPPIASDIRIDGGAAGVTLQIVEDLANNQIRLRFFYVSGGLEIPQEV